MSHFCEQDGHTKQDCETAAAKRWLHHYGDHYRRRRVTILGDDLYSHQPICEAILAQGMHFILVCKPSSHRTLYEWLEGLAPNTVTARRWRGRGHQFDTYRYLNQLPLRDGDALWVNGCELVTTHEQGRVLYRNSFVTDHRIDEHNINAVAKAGDEETEEHLLIDGRNRRLAAKKAKVQPTFVKHEGEPIEYIIMANNFRRHSTKGQRAMMVAIAHPEPTKGGRGKKGRIKCEGFSERYLTKARTVLKHLPHKVEAVKSGQLALNAAYDEAKEAEKASETEEQKEAERAVKFAELREIEIYSVFDFARILAKSISNVTTGFQCCWHL